MKSSLIALLRTGGVAGNVISRTSNSVQVLTTGDEVKSYPIRDVLLTISGSLRYQLAVNPEDLKLEFQTDPERFFLRHLRTASIDGTKRITPGGQVQKDICSIVSPLIPANDVEAKWKTVSERWKRSTGNRDVNLFQDGPGKPFKFQASWSFEPEFESAPVDQQAELNQADAPAPKPASLSQLERAFISNPTLFFEELELDLSDDSLPEGPKTLEPFVRFLELGLHSSQSESIGPVKAKTIGYLEALVMAIEDGPSGRSVKKSESFLRTSLQNFLKYEIWPKSLSPIVEIHCLTLIPFSQLSHARLLNILASRDLPKKFFEQEALERLIARTPWSQGFRRELISHAQHHEVLLHKDLLWSGASLPALIGKSGPDISHLLVGVCSQRLEAILNLAITSGFDAELCTLFIASPTWLRKAIEHVGLTKKLQVWMHSGQDAWLKLLLTNPEIVANQDKLKKVNESAASAEHKVRQQIEEQNKELARQQNLIIVLKNKIDAYEQTRSDQLHALAAAAASDVLKSFALAINEMALHAIDLSPEQVVNRVKHYGLEIGLAEHEQVGELVPFDHDQHDAGEDSPASGEMVIVTRAGFTWLYKGQHTVVLKAKVAIV